MRAILGVTVAAAMLAGGAADAATPCWRAADVSAVRVRQMQTMLMVATLRCRAAGVDFVADYDAFVTRQYTAIAAANLAIKERFAAAGGAQADYDRFATSLANGYGDDETSQASCAEAAALAREGGGAADAAALDAIAAARLFPAAPAGGACEAPSTGSVAGPLAPLATVAPAPAPVSLPADVVAALTVMARFRDAAPPEASPRGTQVAAVAR